MRKLNMIFWLALLSITVAHAVPIIPNPPKLGAASYVLMDYNSGQEFVAHQPDARVEPASITKLMTHYVVLQALREGDIKLDEPVIVSEKAWRTEGSKMFAEVGKPVTVNDLLQGLIIQSGNDASIALAEHVAGTEETFADVMNAEAHRLGMTHTHYVNATGLPHPEHYTTAHDTALLSRALIRDFPKEYARYAQKQFKFNGITQQNRNRLLWQDESVDGLKTGHTASAGYCLVASALRDGMRLISVVMGTDSDQARTEQSQALLSYGFRFFETHKLYAADEPLSQARMWKGEQEIIPVGLAQDLYVTVPKGRYAQLKPTLSINEVVAPVRKGEVVGAVKLILNGEPVTQAPLVALASNPEGGLVRQAKDTVLRWF